MSAKNRFDNLITGKTSVLPGDLKRHKYGVSPENERIANGIKFDSKAEMKRYLFLYSLQEHRHISKLKCQHPRFKWGVTYSTDGKRMIGRSQSYTADFSYTTDRGDDIIEDVKGTRTAEYKRKKKIVEELFDVKILEVEAKDC